MVPQQLAVDRQDSLESFMRLSIVWYNHLRRLQGFGRAHLEALS
ncbi:MAG: hypothetical protein ACLQEQ_08600 [Nitrososphaerales archaeon]